jgi:glycosyltransferase involved in cell wall biosynthesis
VSDGKIVMILSGFPRRSETFALNEVSALEERGALAAIFATKAGETIAMQPASNALRGRVQVLKEGDAAGQAMQVVELLNGAPVVGIHGYFAHSPAEVAEQVALRLGVPFGFSMHAKDARKVAPEILYARARKAACVVACNDDVAKEIRHSGAHVNVVSHGVDLERFSPKPFPDSSPLQILAVGRLVEKKGFHVLLAAVARLHMRFHLNIVGEGPEEKRLMELVRAYGMESSVRFCGPMTHDELPQMYCQAHFLVAPSIIDGTGDRDGLPNVILEAMACGRPVIASDVGATKSAVSHGETGLLTPAGDADRLADAIKLLGQGQALFHQLGARALGRVQREFDVRRCTERFHYLLRGAYA